MEAKARFFTMCLVFCVLVLFMMLSRIKHFPDVTNWLSRERVDFNFQPMFSKTGNRSSPNVFTSGRDTNLTGSSRVVAGNNSGDKIILWYNKPEWVNEFSIEQTLQTCPYRNCHTVSNKESFINASAVIFAIPNGMSSSPPVPPDKRNPDQAWVFFTHEAPSYYGGLERPYFQPGWTSTFNWTMTFFRDADIYFPYGSLEKRPELLGVNYSAIFDQKTKMVAWAVSNCNTPGKRENYVRALQNAGLSVDIYGGCSQQGLSLPRSENAVNITLSQYKFYLAFENSICEDYVTEKLYGYYKYDVIQVVRGGGDYKTLLPENSYINSADFDSPSKLVEHLKSIGSNKTKYIEMLKTKHHYRWDGITDNRKMFCTLCEKLNNLNDNRKIYKSANEHYRQNRCRSLP